MKNGWLRTRRRYFAVALVVFAASVLACHAWNSSEEEATKLAVLLDWKAGSVVAEIGAGDGDMTLAAAERVGAAGRVYTTEIDPGKLARLRELAGKQKLHNITVVEGAAAETNLPPECCDSIFMRHVYHHFSEPGRMDASLFRSVKPGGLVAIIDFSPRKWFGALHSVEGAPKNRGGHGMPEEILVQEMTAAGFQVSSGPLDWPDRDYCVVFRKPSQ